MKKIEFIWKQSNGISCYPDHRCFVDNSEIAYIIRSRSINRKTNKMESVFMLFIQFDIGKKNPPIIMRKNLDIAKRYIEKKYIECMQNGGCPF